MSNKDAFNQPRLCVCLMSSHLMASTFSYHDAGEALFALTDTITGHIKALDDEIARISFKQQGSDITLAVPPGITLTNTSVGKPVPQNMNGFLITWSCNYELRRDGESVLTLRGQRGHVLHSHFSIQ